MVVGVAVTVRSKETIDPDDEPHGSTQEWSCSWWKPYLNSQIKPAWRCQKSAIQPLHASTPALQTTSVINSIILLSWTWKHGGQWTKSSKLKVCLEKKQDFFNWKCHLKTTPVLVGLIQLITDKQLHTSWKMWCSSAKVPSNTLTCLFIRLQNEAKYQHFFWKSLIAKLA